MPGDTEDAGFDVLVAEGEEAPRSGTSQVAGWGRVFRRNRALWIGAVVALAALIGGLLVGTFVLAPASAGGKAPKPGLITAPVEFGPLSNDVTLRADVGYADAVDVTIDTSTVSGAAVVTGQVPAEGATLSSLSIALEVVGRPVIVLPGELPAYRSLRHGVSGPDVLQLKQALSAVGIDPGDMASNILDEDATAAIAQLYAQAGYPAPSPGEGVEESYRAAQESVRSAETALRSARRQLEAAAQTPDADQGALEDAVDAARSQLGSAENAAERARLQTLPYLPSSEVLFLTALPRRVDAVKAKRGSVLQGTAMTVSGATVRLTGSAAEADARLLKAGTTGTFSLPDGTAHTATITEVTNAPAASGAGSPGGKSGTKPAAGGRWQVLFEPQPLTPEQVAALQGSNVRVSVAVGATEGDVLSVPLAALTAGPGGESRVQVVESDPREGDSAKTRTVVVKTGLAARGAVEVTAVEGKLEKGDLVVVGR